ncbi:MAG TPA: DNA-processing protein DprA [Clostridia bacterium]
MAQNLKYWVWLSSMPGIGPLKRKRLIESFGDPKLIWEVGSAELKCLDYLRINDVDQLINQKYRDESERIFEEIYKQGIRVITIQDELYPYYLKNIYDPPVVLYYKGTIQKNEKMVAVVGSRKASGYGLKMAEKLSEQLSENGITVISGLARGIDTYAHRGAMKSSGRTIAVLGCGIDIVYPWENKLLMEKITTQGAVISEYIPGVQPRPQNFPARNRIISGASLGVVVIEAGERSGSLITADFALEQGRDVFAVPGNIESSTSIGTNRLIKEGAKIVTCIEDILEELCGTSPVERPKKIVSKKPLVNKFTELDIEETAVVEKLVDEPLHIDALALKCEMAVQTVSSILVMLELKGVVEQLPGKIFKLND